jgi:hypothetical protein
MLKQVYFSFNKEAGRRLTQKLFCPVLCIAATLAAILYIIPNALPLFSPGKRAVADRTDFGGEICFFVRHEPNSDLER